MSQENKVYAAEYKRIADALEKIAEKGIDVYVHQTTATTTTGFAPAPAKKSKAKAKKDADL